MTGAASDDVEALKARLAEREAEIALMRAELMSKDAVIERLKFQLAVARRAQFGRSSEKLDREIEQLELQLEDLETAAAAAAPIAASLQDIERNRPTRKPLPEHLPRKEIVHEVPRDCPKCGGKLSKLGEDATEILDYAPARFRVIRHVRPKFSCRSCEAIAQAAAPSLPIERGRPGSGLLAHVLVSKYCDHLPLYRQSEIFAREGVEIERSTLADWVGRAAALMAPLVEALRREVLFGPVLHGDDTPVPVLAPGNGKTREGRFWVYVRDERPHGGERPPGVAYFYSPDRKGERPRTHLKDFSGVLHADGYAGFNKLYEDGRIREAACWAHVRRKFFDVAKALNSPLAREALDKIGALYGIEEDIRGQSPEQRTAARRARASPLLDDMRAWFDA
jgi:transposase